MGTRARCKERDSQESQRYEMKLTMGGRLIVERLRIALVEDVRGDIRRAVVVVREVLHFVE